MKKRIFALLLAFVMLVGMLPVSVVAAVADLPVSGGRVDITDTAVGSYTLQYLEIYHQNTYEAVSIVSATQDGNTINVVLSEDTDPAAALQAGFGGSGQGALNHSGNKCTLSNGTGSMAYAVAVRLGPQMTGSATFTVNFTVPMGEACTVTPPAGEGFTFTGKETAYKDSAYSFQIAVKEGYDGTNMTVSCKSGGESVKVTADGNGNYTIASVPGDITIQVSGVVAKTKYHVTRESCQGVTVAGPELVYAGDSCSFTVAVDGAYDATNMVVAVDGETVGTTAGEYKIDSVTADTKITVTGVVKKTGYTVTLTEGENYTISGQATSYAGEPYTFSVAVDDAIYWASNIVVKVNGETVTLTGGSYTIEALNADTVVIVENVVERKLCTVTKSAAEGVTFTGSDSVREGKPYSFTVTVSALYNTENMVVTYRMGEKNGEVKADNGAYTIPSVTGNVTVTVSGLTKKDVCVVEKPTGNKFTFEGTDFAYQGSDYTFTVTPQLGYVATVSVNGEVITGTNNQYTIKADGETLTIAVATERIPMPETQLPIENNVIDITDKLFASYFSSRYYATASTITVTGAEVLKAYEDGTNVYIIVSSDTEEDASVSATVNCTVKEYTVSGNSGNCQLDDGDGYITLKLTGKYGKYNIGEGTVTYNVIIFKEIPSEEPPARVMESDTAEVWKGWPLEIDLNKYFIDADTYYLVKDEIKTPIEGSVYTYMSPVAGEYTLVLQAENEVGFSEPVTVTVSVKDVESGVYISNATSNGSLDSVQFYQADGEAIEGIEIVYDQSGRIISVVLPKDYPVRGTVTAKFNLTQNASGYPFVSQSTETTGNRAYNSRFTERSIQLTNGAANFVFYYYNSSTGATNNGGQTKFTISIKMKNDRPELAEGVESAVAATVTAGQEYALDLRPIFTDIDNDTLTYQYKVGSGDWQDCGADFTYSNAVAAEYVLTFRAFDAKDYSTEYYTVTLTVENVKDTYDMTVSVPAGLEPKFYVSTGFVDGVDQLGDAVAAVAGETADGMTAYTLSYPQNAEMLSVRAEGWGGMAFPAEENGTVTFRQVKLSVVDYEKNAAESTNTVTCGETKVVAGTEGWLLVTGQEYTYTAVPKDTTTLDTVTETETLEAGAGVYIREIVLNIRNPIAITVPTGAKAQLYNIDTSKYYAASEFDAKIVKDNGDGTTTYFFVGDTKANGACFVYRVSMDGKITKVGYMTWGKQSVTVTYTDADKSDTYRLDNYSGTGYANSDMTEDSVLLNINSRNNLSLSVGETKTLKAYRAWEIIKISYQNYILTPDFTYTVLSGEDVVSLTEKDSPSTADGDWMTLTALKPGVAIIEVTYGAMEVTGGSYDGIYGASDPARTGIVVVQVGGNDSSVDFGIDCFASAGKGYSDHIAYNSGAKRVWDAEFDTLYFTGSSGELKLSPNAASAITEVAVSHDKGGSWTVLDGENGSYTAKIVSGNNIIRVTTASGTAYQVVRGDRISVSLKEVDGKSDGDGTVEAGETVRVSLIGLHMPIPKMAGNYNPGFGGNSDGYSSVHLNYTANGKTIWGPGSQYNFITASNYVEITMPEDGSSVTLADGYIGVGVIGLTAFTTGGDSHRNIPDSGCGTRDSKTTFHTRSILPEITIEAGGESAPNCAPVVRGDAVTEGSIYSDQNYALNPDTLFSDPDGNVLTFTVSVDGGAAEKVGVDYKFTPGKVGTYKLTFTASDGKETVQHSVTVTVTERPKEEEKDETFGLNENEIAGYVTISFVDRGVRVAGETGLKYPVPLGTIIASTKVPFRQGENIAQVTKRLLDHLDIGMSYSGSLTSGFYLGAISGFEVGGTPYGSMGEFDAGVGSGWMITQNGIFINQGASEFKVHDGDILKWQYTCQLGADIGDNSYYGSVTEVIKLIDEIGTVTLRSGEKIEAARKAYDSLPTDEQKRVSNYETLKQAEAEYTKLKTAEDEKKAEAVEKLIDSIIGGSITFEDDVKTTQKAYNNLTADQKKLVDNYYKLANYLKELADEEDVEAAEAVEKLIEDLDTVTLDSEEGIRAAREAYEKLTDEQKALVENLAVLEAAEEKLAKLKDAALGENIYKTTGDYLEHLGTPAPGSIGGEWMVIGLIRSGREVQNADAYYDAAVKFVQENIDGNGRLHRAKSTENSRMILALTAMGKDVTDVGGHDLLAGLSDMTYIQKQGINGPIWALIALDSGNYPAPGGDVTREALIQLILDAQLADGGWALSGSTSDPDMTGMALQALAPYYNTDADVKKAVDTALITLSDVQQADGSFSSIDGKNIESIAQVVTALAALGIDADTDPRFIKNGISALDALCAFYVEGGGFRHTMGGKLDGMATEQGYYALTAYYRMLDHQNFLYNMTDVVDMGGDKEVKETDEAKPDGTEPDEQDHDEAEDFPWWLVIVILALAGAIAVLLIIAKPKKGRHMK